MPGRPLYLAETPTRWVRLSYPDDSEKLPAEEHELIRDAQRGDRRRTRRVW